MTTINKLTRTDEVGAGDLVPVYIQNQGDARAAAMSVLLAYIQANIVFPTDVTPGVFATQYASPSATAFNIPITPGSNNVWLILTPTTGFATGTITLPPVAGVVDKQEVLVNCTQQVTALTVNGNGAIAVTGEPTSLGADGFFKLRYDFFSSSWYRVG